MPIVSSLVRIFQCGLDGLREQAIENGISVVVKKDQGIKVSGHEANIQNIKAPGRTPMSLNQASKRLSQKRRLDQQKRRR